MGHRIVNLDVLGLILAAGSMPLAGCRETPPAEPASNTAPARAVTPPTTCSADMAPVGDGSVCIDRYESHLGKGDLGPGDGSGTAAAAKSEKGVLPRDRITYHQAAKTCRNAGKRMCTKAEWLSACQGKTGRKFPYGIVLETTRCNGHDYSDPARQPLGVVATGSFPRCRPPEAEIFDLSGNLWEWIDETTPSGTESLMCGGGFSNAIDDLECGCESLKSSEGYEGVGFRCCRDL